MITDPTILLIALSEMVLLFELKAKALFVIGYDENRR